MINPTRCANQQDGLTALMVGANKGYLSVVEVLLEGGADVNHQHKVRRTN